MSKALENGVKRFLTQTLTEVRSPVWGESGPTYSAVYTNVPCRFIEESEWIRGDQEHETLVTAHMYVAAEYALQVGQSVVFGDNEYRIVKLKAERDEGGTLRYWKVWVV